jgi:DNA repair ATPase RecN
VLQRTTSSKENENIKSLIEFKENPIEEVTLSSDEEEDLESPPYYSLDADESDSNTAECNIPSMPTLSNLPATKDEEKELPEDTDEKLRNIVKRIKPNEKSTPKPLSSGRGKAKSFKPKKLNSIRNQLQKDPNLTSYYKSVKDANERNDSHSKCSSFQYVSTVGNKCHDSIPTHKPSFPTPVPVKVQQEN